MNSTRHPAIDALIAALKRIPTCRVTSAPTTFPLPAALRANPFLLFFAVDEVRWLYVIGRATDRNYGGYGFMVELSTSDVPDDPVGFCLTSLDPRARDLRASRAPVEEAAGALAARIHGILDRPTVLLHFGLDPARVGAP